MTATAAKGEAKGATRIRAKGEATQARRVREQKQLESLESTGLTHALASLDDRSRRIIEARWLGEDHTATLHDLADEFGVSAERIRQIEKLAMGKLKHALEEIA